MDGATRAAAAAPVAVPDPFPGAGPAALRRHPAATGSGGLQGRGRPSLPFWMILAIGLAVALIVVAAVFIFGSSG